MKGLFITFEGLDGGGKSTQLQKAAAALRQAGYQVLESREPGGTETAEKVRSMVLDAELPLSNTTQALLYLAARSEHVDKVLRPALEAGSIVLCDRFSDSTLVYQGLAAGKSARELELLRQMNAYAAEGVLPQLTLVLDGDPDIMAERRVKRGITDRYEKQGLAFQRSLREGFLYLAKREPLRMKVINAEADEETVHQEIMSVLRGLLDGK